MIGLNRTWAVGIKAISTLVAISAMGLLLTSSPLHATERTEKLVDARGEVDLVLGPSFVQQMFKACMFIYGSSDVRLGLGDNQSMRVYFPLKGTSKASPTTVIKVDDETGGMDFFNGPAGATASLVAPVVRRTGSTGFITGTLIGPYSKETGQFAETMPVFAMSSARTKASGTGWTMTANLSLTDQGASTLNTLLATNYFQAGARVGHLDAEVMPAN